MLMAVANYFRLLCREEAIIKHYLLIISSTILIAGIFLFADICYCQPINTPEKHYKALGLKGSNHGSMSVEETRKILKGAGGKIISFPKGGFFLEWFPENWESIKNRHIIISLHGNGGHAERMFNFWYRNRCFHNYAIIALQYAATDNHGKMQFQDCREIYRNLRFIVNHLKKSGLINSSDALILHGFSRGSARIFELAALDRSKEGMHIFSAFIADSGTSLAENKGRLPQFLRNLSPDAYNGARFWLYTGSRDHGGRTVIGMGKMKKFIINHGGKIDDLFIYDTNLHGIFITGGPQKESEALTALFRYIDSIKPVKATKE